MIDLINNAVIKIDKQLKGFQTASVNYVLEQLYEKNRNKVLIADEVGLGKTIIAKGVIAKSVKKFYNKERPFHVVYICSNQVLAHQNIKKLNPFDQNEAPLKRLIFLALEPNVNVNSPIRLSSLTPNTSFKLTNSVGYKEERAIIFKLLNEYADFSNYESSWIKLMKGNRLIREDSWLSTIERYNKNEYYTIRHELAKNFKDRLQNTTFDRNKFKGVIGLLKYDGYKSFYHALTALLRQLDKHKETIDPLDYSYEIIRVLRKELTQECVNYLNADLFILDEFQRFKTLLDGDDQSEATEIAKAVLHNDESKVLLLSATPFKPFTTHLEQINGENHYSEFKQIVEYLGGSKGKKLWNNFRKDQEAFFEILRHPQLALDDNKLAKDRRNKLELSFKKFLSRNERLSVASDYNNMTISDPNDKTDVISEDIKNFIALDQLVQMLEANMHGKRKRLGSTLEFSKSAPYPLSFLYGYSLKKYLDENKSNPDIKSLLKGNRGAWLDYNKINNYEPVGFHNGKPNYPNGKFRVLANECFKDNGEFLLWIPPSKPKYNLFGKYRNTGDFSKILLFSGWAMAPRAIASLLSYEVERRTIGSELLRSNKEKVEQRTYFSDPRRPSRRLDYSIKVTASNKSYNMWMFNLSYPCRVFFENNEYRELKISNHSYFDIKKNQEKRIKKLFDELKIKERFENKKQGIDKVWYWISAPLLDYIKYVGSEYLKDFINSSIDKEKEDGKFQHFAFLENNIKKVLNGEKKLGRIPDDLFRILAEISLSSPANASALALYNNYKSGEYRNENNDLHIHAYKCAEAFISLFNKPESISAVRLSINKGKEYWKKVLRYCASGSISDLLEEYIYMLKHSNGIEYPNLVAEQLNDVLGVKTSSINVDLSNGDGNYDTYSMRCHFALNYGDQKINTDSGTNRMVNIRSIFNSPFRPFVLASTSVGQEGLDFHFYCRKIFHWNLPYNAIDLEQREGRINRYKGLVIRQKLAETINDIDVINKSDKSIWENIFDLAEAKYENDKSGIKPFWYLDEGKSKIERFVPFHPLSKDLQKYNQLKSTLALYRLTFGQPRQEELVQALESLNLSEKDIIKLRSILLVNLSPLIQK